MQSSTSIAPVWHLCSVSGSVPNTLHNPQSKIALSQNLPDGSRALGYPGAPIQEAKYRGPGGTLPVAPSTWHCKAWPRPYRRVRPREAEAGTPGAVSPGHAHLASCHLPTTVLCLYIFQSHCCCTCAGPDLVWVTQGASSGDLGVPQTPLALLRAPGSLPSCHPHKYPYTHSFPFTLQSSGILQMHHLLLYINF